MKFNHLENDSERYDVLIDLFYKQFMEFADYLNDSNGKVESFKYADYVLFCLKQKLIKDNPGNDDFFE